MNKRKLGGEMEKLAAETLRKAGYRILQSNYRCPAGEIDLIARHGKYLVFVEVKYRSTGESGQPCGALLSGRTRDGRGYSLPV